MKIPRTDAALASIPEATNYLGIGRTRLYALMREQALPFVKHGRTRLMSWSDLRAFLAKENKQGSSNGALPVEPAPAPWAQPVAPCPQPMASEAPRSQPRRDPQPPTPPAAPGTAFSPFLPQATCLRPILHMQPPASNHEPPLPARGTPPTSDLQPARDSSASPSPATNARPPCNKDLPSGGESGTEGQPATHRRWGPKDLAARLERVRDLSFDLEIIKARHEAMKDEGGLRPLARALSEGQAERYRAVLKHVGELVALASTIMI